MKIVAKRSRDCNLRRWLMMIVLTGRLTKRCNKSSIVKSWRLPGRQIMLWNWANVQPGEVRSYVTLQLRVLQMIANSGLLVTKWKCCWTMLERLWARMPNSSGRQNFEHCRKPDVHSPLFTQSDVSYICNTLLGKLLVANWMGDLWSIRYVWSMAQAITWHSLRQSDIIVYLVWPSPIHNLYM